jgi:tryptophan halogenase
MKIKKICVLGGGTAGFLFTSLLEKYKKISKIEFDIVQVYSSKTDTIGVGESTLGTINDFFSFIDLKDEEWMKKCDATYKTSIRFEDFYKKETNFQYPFGKSQHTNENLWTELKDIFPDYFTSEKASRFFNQRSYLPEYNKLTEKCEELEFNLNTDAAYHFNSAKLANFLKERLNVKIIDDEYISATKDEKGNIKSLNLKNNVIEADLFVDCTGFKSLLLSGAMNEKFIDYGDTLINNKALVSKFKYKDKNQQLKSYTNCHALKNGWCWEIPLWNEISVGYVHTNKFASKEEIFEEFKEHCKQFGDLEDYKVINYKTGRYEKGWVKNVVAVGLSYGFLEPLESTGIASLLVNSFRLLEVLSKRDMFITKIDKDAFNYSVGKDNLDNLKDFIELHYYLSSRSDSEYWDYVTNGIDYDNDRLVHRSIVSRNFMDNDLISGIPYITYGMNYSAFSKAFNLKDKKKENLKKIKDDFQQVEKKLKRLIEKYPSTYEFHKETIYRISEDTL